MEPAPRPTEQAPLRVRVTRWAMAAALVAAVAGAMEYRERQQRAAGEAARKQVVQALQIAGVVGYKNDSKFSVGRHYRDALSGALMVSNERINSKSASMLLVLKDE